MRIDVFGVGFDNITMEEAAEKAMSIRGGYVVTPNPEMVWLARKDDEFRNALEGAALSLPDGIGIVYGAKILGRPLKTRVPGIEFAEEMFKRFVPLGKSVFLLGAKPGVAEKAAENLRIKYPGLIICGTADGFFKDDTPIINEINEKEPDFLLVCLGFPKQELWMQKYSGKLNVGLMAGLGGVLDVFAGVAERAPEAWCNAGFEWLYRLIKQPSRIGRMAKLPLFLFAVIGQRLKGG
jgi:N-acetylglucosaminyldiphosphoundecaprenol N-acetyl-beta-D-mannosaminyltransferase